MLYTSVTSWANLLQLVCVVLCCVAFHKVVSIICHPVLQLFCCNLYLCICLTNLSALTLASVACCQMGSKSQRRKVSSLFLTHISSLFLEIVSLFSARLHQTLGPYVAPRPNSQLVLAKIFWDKIIKLN